MNRQALELDYPRADTLPEAGTALEIAPGGKRPLRDDGIYRFSAR
jgi:hypothetical protein